MAQKTNGTMNKYTTKWLLLVPVVVTVLCFRAYDSEPLPECYWGSGYFNEIFGPFAKELWFSMTTNLYITCLYGLAVWGSVIQERHQK